VDDREALPRAILDIALGFLAREPMEAPPCGVGEIEERRAARVDEVAPVGRDTEGVDGGTGGRGAEQDDEAGRDGTDQGSTHPQIMHSTRIVPRVTVRLGA